MPNSDAFLIGENWLSEHFFTTDATSESFQSLVIKRRKQWDEDKSADRSTDRVRFSEARSTLLSALAELGENPEGAADVYVTLKRVLGYDNGGYSIRHNGPVETLTAGWLGDTGSVALVAARPVEAIDALLEKNEPSALIPFELEDGSQVDSVARILSHLFIAEDGPAYALTFAGQWMMLAEKERWAEGRYLAVNLLLVAERNDEKRGGEIDRALAVLSRESVAPGADGSVWWNGVLEQSIKHTVGVSKDLREGIRLSIEIIANDVLTRRRERGLGDDEVDPQELARQALRFLYRILFLLYAETSPELGVLPVGAEEYDRGYGLDRLRDLTLVDLTEPRTRVGTHFYDSLNKLFALVDEGHASQRVDAEPDDAKTASALAPGLRFDPLKADLFLPSAIALLGEVKLGNAALQRVLQHLLLSKQQKGRDRGFISYAELGINQLGAVYEGLMSYTGFIAEDDLYEVAKGGDSSRGSWVIPVGRADSISDSDFVKTKDPDTDQPVRVLHRRGTFVYRLAGRERQQSASYYTPEVLTRFVVSQALEELLDQDGRPTTAREILDLTVCEPALGSGAFAIEAVRQLAEQYLKRRQAELGERIEPDEYPRRLQEVKAYLALHQVYGVDLNSTAVELAEISLWLDTMTQGLQAPWFGLHLRRGNSLIGARRAVFSTAQINGKEHLTSTPTSVPLTELKQNLAEDRVAGDTAGKVHHFLLPAAGWGSAIDSKEATELAPDQAKALKTWRNSVKAKLTKKQVEALVNLSYRVETLWQLSLRRLEIAETEIRRSIAVWGADDLPSGGAVTREQIETALQNPNGAYQRLRRVMDAWTALWFWPLSEEATPPPSIDDWIAGLQALLGKHHEQKAKAAARGAITLSGGSAWDDLGYAEESDLSFGGVSSVDDGLIEHPWLGVCESISRAQGFFHWDLDFASVFARGGFDLQLGNPPWVRPRSDVGALLAEGDPWWQLQTKATQQQLAEKRRTTLSLSGTRELVIMETGNLASTAAFLGSADSYPYLTGLQPDLYRCFIERTWAHGSVTGITALLHPESHFTDEKARRLRAATYGRLRRHWQFLNELQLFAEVDHHLSYGVHIYGTDRAPRFLSASSLYHPDTIERSLVHDGSGAAPGIKDDEGKWDLRPHKERIIEVDDDVLATWHAVLESPEVPVRQSRMLYTVNRASSDVLAKLARQPRIGDLGLDFSAGWHETMDRKKGRFDAGWGRPDSWSDVILQGPHLFVSTPMYKSPNETMLHNQDWTATDFETLEPDAIPITSYKPTGDRALYDHSYTRWGDAGERAARSSYRVAWRKMAANTGARTLIAAIIPPGAAHVDAVFSATPASGSLTDLVLIAGCMSSLLSDFVVRAAPKANIRFSTVERLPFNRSEEILNRELAERTLKLQCLTSEYSTLWQTIVRDMSINAPEKWDPAVPYRNSYQRREAQVEIDALAALMLGISPRELADVYRNQFAVLRKYEREHLYDRNGRLVPMSMAAAHHKAGANLTREERLLRGPTGAARVYEYPFRTLDREEDMHRAFDRFEKLLRASE